MKRTTLASSSPELRVNVPSSWEELDGAQLQYILRLLSLGVPPEHTQVYAFLRFSGLRVMERGALYRLLKDDTETIVVRKGRRLYPLSRRDLSLAAMELDFIGEPPPVPQRPDKWHGVPAVDAALHGVPFGVYLQLENYMQRYLQQPEEALLLDMACLLYPGLRANKRNCLLSLIVLHWMTGVKMLYSRLYPDLYRPAASTDELPDLREVMLAQIRALTSGDVTKEHKVLNVDTWTALAELNAKAREAREAEKMYNK